MRDLMALQRLTKVNRVTLAVACDPQLVPHLPSLGVQHVDNFLNANLTRVYVERGLEVPENLYERIPSGEDLEVVSIKGNTEELPGLVVDPDPYAGVKFYKDWHAIPETMPLTQKAPPKNGEPLMSPFL
jgi:hypothetical protein